MGTHHLASLVRWPGTGTALGACSSRSLGIASPARAQPQENGIPKHPYSRDQPQHKCCWEGRKAVWCPWFPTVDSPSCATSRVQQCLREDLLHLPPARAARAPGQYHERDQPASRPGAQHALSAAGAELVRFLLPYCPVPGLSLHTQSKDGALQEAGKLPQDTQGSRPEQGQNQALRALCLGPSHLPVLGTRDLPRKSDFTAKIPRWAAVSSGPQPWACQAMFT